MNSFPVPSSLGIIPQQPVREHSRMAAPTLKQLYALAYAIPQRANKKPLVDLYLARMKALLVANL